MNLRLLVTKDCNRSCAGCCNKDWDLDALSVVESYKGYEMILLTGGEPLLYPDRIQKTVHEIRAQTDAPIILYTASSERLFWVYQLFDGVTLTLHRQADVEPFNWINVRLMYQDTNKMLRLNVFKGVDLTGSDLHLWDVRDNIEWIEDCSLPEHEEFRRLA